MNMHPHAPIAAAYTCPWTVYGLSWSNRLDEKLLAVTSFTEEYDNHLQILKVVDATPDIPATGNPSSVASDGTDMDVDESSSKEKVELQSQAVSVHPYPATKVLWCPDDTSAKLATTADYLRLWHTQGDSIQLSATLSKNRVHRNSSPLTSADWSVADPNILGACSLDTTICIWDLNVRTKPKIHRSHRNTRSSMQNTKVPKREIVAHDAEVYDMAFSTGTNVFASVGGDGTLRVFDLRNLDSCTLLYETADMRPLVRLAWNALDTNYIATMLADGPAALVLDLRLPSIPVMELPASPTDGRGAINAFAWSPSSAHHIVTASDHHDACLWDIAQSSQQRRPLVDYSGESRHINQLQWSSRHPRLLAVGVDDSVQVVHV
ncbi:hypothetical protein DYB34_003413 [Aphanomyces astaci]|uniref:Uncharacterized protein n=1 Tax=Aphanomyces astaci TaxID=112090 RepID=A0A418C0L9_APHAT|nr:hypothetical protein DYB34_003413 [Aphanomyces astaci]